MNNSGLTERVKITKTSFTNSHTYLIQADKDINDRANYIVPFDDPDINLRSDYQIYRRINGSFNLLKLRLVGGDWAFH